MSWQAWVALIMGIIGLLIVFVGFVVRSFGKAGRANLDDGDGNGTVALGVGVMVLAFVILLLGLFTIVGTRQIGIETVFGRPNGQTLSNGLHWKAPWANVNEMDGAIQIDKHIDDQADENNRGSALTIRLGNSSTAWADTSVRWEIKQDAADELFVQYKTFANVRDNLITRNLQVALNEVFATYDPLAPQNLDTSPLPGLSTRATKIMQDKVGSQVTIFEVQVPTIAYDGNTEEKINNINAQRADTAKALESQKTAEAQAKANAILSQSVNNDPNVLVSKCLDVARDKGLALMCWPMAVSPVLPVGR